MSTEGYSEDFYKGPAYALVIGISNYKNGCDPGQGLAPNQFPNLKFAAKDAEDFANFLRHYGFINYNVASLLNEDADLNGIKVELEKLRENCKQSQDPLVIVYFSGHGWADAEERHYLIPWEAERDQLRATAFMNKEFNGYLDELPTKRLVVFLDACHSGAMGIDGARGGVQQYVYEGLGAGEGRYLIASCGPGQQSYEWKEKENGIFTRHLIDLLACKTGDFTDEQINIFHLYPKLIEKVEATARALKCPGKQVPIGEMRAGRGIILAINQRVRERRVQEDREAHEQRIRFLELICDLIKKSNSRQKTIIAVKLRRYVDKAIRPEGYDDFFGVFDEYLDLWKHDQRSRMDECRDLLIETHGEAVDSPALSKDEQSQQPSKPDDKFVSAAENKVLGAEESTAPATPLSPSETQQPKRQLSTEDRDYLLEEIITKLRYYSVTNKLRDVLSLPISEAEFATTIYRIGESMKDDDVLRGIIEKIIKRFEDRWPKSKKVESTTVSSLMLGKGR
jgi:hypothetical protein